MYVFMSLENLCLSTEGPEVESNAQRDLKLNEIQSEAQENQQRDLKLNPMNRGSWSWIQCTRGPETECNPIGGSGEST